MVLVFILELSGGISGYVLRTRAEEVIREKMMATMPEYKVNGSEIAEAWDTLQREVRKIYFYLIDLFFFIRKTIFTRLIACRDCDFQFECCGASNATDWLIAMDQKLPMSCCKTKYGELDSSMCNVNSTNLFTDGCLWKFQGFVRAHAVQLGGVGIGIAFVQVSSRLSFLEIKTFLDFSDFFCQSVFSGSCRLISHKNIPKNVPRQKYA